MESVGTSQVNVSADDALGGDDVMELLHRLTRRDVSARELRESAQARISAAGELNAVVCNVDLIPEEGGPFTGIPTAVKDNQDLNGYPTRHGSSATPSTLATRDMPFVGHLRGLGFDPLVKTTLPEFGLTATTESTTYGATRNP
ncbi:MAG: amidase family protein, partial [Candidatus Nanopelagicales bacterium]